MIDFEKYEKFVVFETDLGFSIKDKTIYITTKNSLNSGFSDLKSDTITKLTSFLTRDYLVIQPIFIL